MHKDISDLNNPCKNLCYCFKNSQGNCGSAVMQGKMKGMQRMLPQSDSILTEIFKEAILLDIICLEKV